jgi:uncharacterized protein (TIGR02757 family)
VIVLSQDRAQILKPLLERHLAAFDTRSRRAEDPVEFSHRYSRREDIEVTALISCCLAYGRVDLFRPKLAALFEFMGESPADFVSHFDPAKREHRRGFEGFVYRFNLAGDMGLLTAGIGRLLREHGSLEAAWPRELPLQQALSAFVAKIRSHPQEKIIAELGPIRGLDHLLPEPMRGGSCKRLLLFLRWMVRGPDEVDFGLWSSVPRSKLVIPLDTHIGRISKHLGLTDRTDLSWRTAEEITDGLRLIDPDDPVKYDFVLCHTGMSGACPSRLSAEHCRVCSLQPACRTGRRKVRSRVGSGRRRGRDLETGPLAG